MIFYGIDPSLTSTGLGRICHGHIAHMAIQAKKNDHPSMYPRVQEIVDRVVRELPSDPSSAVVCIEAPFIHVKHINGAMSILGLAYHLRHVLYSLGFRFVNVAPSQLKKFIGARTKAQVIAGVAARWGVDCKTSDEADAVVLAKIAEGFSDPRPILCKKQYEVVMALRKKEGACN